ncbi:MBL fold metallo-hydrolase [Candidatus Micrarchaeota archaeon]|nr:MBL fold metallo-hydrolase [Candidatus Micrarchaeota archaeon]
MVSVYCMGASQEVGRSAFLLNTDKTLLLDYGIKIFGKNGEAEFPLDFNEKTVDAAIISHAHMDHSGFLPNLYTFSKTRWIGTPPTHDLCEILLADSMKIMGEKLPFDQSHYKKALKYWIPAVYERPMQVGKTEIRLFDAGHIAGSAMIELDYEGRKILYSGDIKLDPTRMHDGLKYDEEVDVLFIESTYSNREHPERKEIEQQLIEEIEETTGEGGTVLLPSFALGRTQELVRVIRAHNKDVPVFVDGMGKQRKGQPIIQQVCKRCGSH